MQKIELNSAYAWILAARPKTLTGAIIPVMIGAALAIADHHFQWIPTLICALFAGLMQIAANFINDLYDYLKGTDNEQRLGPLRACAQGWITPSAMKKGILITIILAASIGSLLLFYGGIELIAVGALCILFAFLYTTGPYPLSYKGWGDVLVLLFFGLVPVAGTYYVQALTLNPKVIIAALMCGIIIDTLLVLNNFRDRTTDAESGKLTIIVRLGENFGKYFYLSLGVMAAFMALYFITVQLYYAALLPQLYLIPHYKTWQKMVRINRGKELNIILGETSRNILIFGLLFSLGLIIH